MLGGSLELLPVSIIYSVEEKLVSLFFMGKVNWLSHTYSTLIVD